MSEYIHQARVQREQGALAVLRLVHESSGISRAELTRRLGLSSSSATEIVARLRADRVLTEVEPALTGQRGRPSPQLAPHPEGPLALAVELTHAGWRVAALELGLHEVETRSGRHRRRDPDAVSAAIRSSIRELHATFGERLRVVSVSVPATVVGQQIVQAATLGWSAVDAADLVPRALADRPLLAGNDATLAGLAEARRGAARSASVALYLTVEVGVGGVLIVGGSPITGTSGAGGEFGHLPFGDPKRRCPCGALGCWDVEVDGRAMARSLRASTRGDPRGFASRVIAAARAGGRDERQAVVQAATALGRGTGGLVNALDPQIVVYGGLAPDLLETAGDELGDAYRRALMRYRRDDPPPIEPEATGGDGSLLGAAEAAFDTILSADELAAWRRRRG